MANLRRHFNFSAKSSVHQDPFSMSSTRKISCKHIDKHSLMNDICNCLDLCCSYIQALNSLCGAGSSLAKSLFHTVRDIPTYHGISRQFLSVWEDVSKATAGASAAVKTETLMMLQELLNALEMSTNEANADDTIAESFQVIGTCLCSFIELQAQFSWSTWKSLSKLSKTFTNDSFRQSLQWKSLDRNPCKISVNADLNSTIKKHFSQLSCKVGVSKVNEPVENNQSQFYSSSFQVQTNSSIFSHFGNENASRSTTDKSVWKPPTTVWTSSDCSNVHCHGSLKPSEQDSQNSSILQSDLDEVINLLSCVPAQSSDNKMNSQNQNYFSYSSDGDQMYHFLPKGCGPTVARQLDVNRFWPKDPRDINLGYESWIWRVDNMNCSALSGNSDGNNETNLWDTREMQKWNASSCETGSSSDDGSSVHGLDIESFPCGINNPLSRHLLHPLSDSVRRSVGGESLPGGLEKVSENKDEYLQEVQSKISTWPLKQSAFRNSENKSLENSDHLKYSGLNFVS